MYGLPDSFVVGTIRRAKGFMSKNQKSEIRQDINWLYGWLALGALYGTAWIIFKILSLF